MRGVPQTRPAGGGGRPRLGELLVQAGCITAAQLESALREQSSWGGRLGENLVHEGVITEEALATAIARQLRLRVVQLDRLAPPDEIARLVPFPIAERYGIVAIARQGNRVLVVCSDPTHHEALEQVRRATGLFPEACVATASEIERFVRRHYYGESEPAVSPDPRLNVSRTPVPRRPEPADPADRIEGLERQVQQLLEAVRNSRASGT